MIINRLTMNNKRYAALALAIICAILVTSVAGADGGALDVTFDGDGKVTTDFGGDEAGSDLAIQPDGKIVVAGSNMQGILLVRYNSDGSPDSTFGSGGNATASFGGVGVRASAIALQPDGKILVVGLHLTGLPNNDDLALARFNSNGSLDPTFDSDGKVTTDFAGTTGFVGTNDSGSDLAIQPDGKIVVVGNSLCVPCIAVDFVLARYNSDGSLDTTFDGDGKVGPVFSSVGHDAYALVLQPDGRIIVAGSAWEYDIHDFLLARYNSDGSPDTSFGTGGTVWTDFGGGLDNAHGLILQPDGKILVAGNSTTSSLLSSFALARYNSDGSLDTTFDTDGRVTTGFGFGSDYGSDVALQSGGRIVVTGRSHNGANLDFALARYNGNGSLDQTFHTDGKLLTDFGGSDAAENVAIQPDDKIVVVGYAKEDFALVRYTDYAFDDVPPSYWAWTWIERLYNAGITSGCAMRPLEYCPDGMVTRAQMAVLFLRGVHTSAYIPPDMAGSTGFGDVPPDYWAAAWIKQLAVEGITTGCGSGNYCPENSVTRAQMAVFLLRSKHGASYIPPAVGAGTGFGDVQPDYWAAAWIKQLVIEGITTGCGNGNYCPENPVTRAQMAVFLVRTFSLP